MINNTKQIKYIKAITPIHAGAGQELGTVDMPIQRERHTNIPKIEASSLKGSIKNWIRKSIEENDEGKKDSEENLYKFLGKDENADAASEISLTDVRLLFFPIRSSEDIFKLVTCPYILRRWASDLSLIQSSNSKNVMELRNFLNDIEDIKMKSGVCFVNKCKNNKIFLEEYMYTPNTDVKDTIFKYIKSKININIDKLVIIEDEEFVDLVTMYTEVITRNRIDIKTGATEKGGLFTEEYLPSESILYFLAFESDKYESREKEKDLTNTPLKFLKEMLGQVFQIGGDATIGKGLVKFIE